MHASAQPAAPVRRIDLIKICLLCYRTRCMECGPGGVPVCVRLDSKAPLIQSCTAVLYSVRVQL
jgi:hypothetical protein